MKRWNDNQASMQIEAPIRTLASFAGGTVGTGHAQFRVPIIDPRLRTFLGLEIVPPAGSNFTTVQTQIASTCTLWLFEEQDDRGGTSGIILPLTNLQGSTKAAPITWPNPGLFGFAVELVSIAQYVGGIVAMTPGLICNILMDVIYKPEAGATFTQSEWEQLVARAIPTTVVGPDQVP